MKLSYTIAFISFLTAIGASQASYAEKADNNIMIIASPTKQSATSLNKNAFFTQRFDIQITNAGNQNIDMAKLCFVAQNPEGNKFHTDVVEDTLVSGILKPGQSVKGFAGFSGENNAVYDARLIKASVNCK